MISVAVMLIVVNVLSKILGFVREMVMSYYYGTNMVAEAFVIAQTVPFVIFNFFAAGITTGFIPNYNSIERDEGLSAADRFTSNLANLILVLSLIISLIAIIFAKPLVLIFASGFTGEKLDLAILFTRITFTTMFANSMTFIFYGYLNIKGNFFVPATTGFLLNIIIISSIVISAYTQYWILAVGTALAMVFQNIFYLPAIKKTGYVHRWEMNAKNPQIKSMLIMAIPVIFGVAANETNTLIDKTLSSLIMDGGVAILNYANRLNTFLVGIVIISISTAAYPVMSKLVSENKIDELKNNMMEYLSSMNLLIFPGMVGMMVFAKPIVSILFERGAFTAQDVILVSGCLFFYALSLEGIAIRDIFSKAFYVLKDTKTPTINAFLMVAMNLVFSIILSRYMGITGLALGTSLAATISPLILVVLLKRRLGNLGLRRAILNGGKMLAASLLMGLVSKLVYDILLASIPASLALVVAIVIAILIYGIAILLLKVEEADSLMKKVRKKLHRQ